MNTVSGVVYAPLRVEQVTLRSAGRSAGGLRVLRTGMGPVRAARAVAGLAAGGGPVAVAGLGGGLVPGLRAGDIVVASEVRGTTGHPVPSPSAPLLAGALRRRGSRVRLGPVVSSDRVVDGRSRHELTGSGALAVDMESAALAAGTAGRPFAVLRSIVDTIEHPLWSPGTPLRGVLALRALRRAVPALGEWAAAAGAREVLLVGPRSICAGAEPAIDAVARAVRAVARECDLVLVVGSGNASNSLRPAEVVGSGNASSSLRPAEVVGSGNSSNSLRLAEVAAREGVPAQLVDDAGDVDLAALSGARRVGIAAGASAPPHLVEDLVRCLAGLGPVTVRETSVTEENVQFTLPREAQLAEPPPGDAFQEVI